MRSLAMGWFVGGRSNAPPLLVTVVLAMSFATPQVWLGLKFGGLLGGIGVVALCLAGFAVAAGVAKSRWSRFSSPWFVGPAFIVLSTLLLWVAYPLANSQNALGGGGDADEAIQIATSRLLAGLSPYAETTYLNNPITPLPGTLVLYAPAEVVLGATVWMSPILLAIAFLLLARASSIAMSALVFALALSPMFWQAWVTGSDYVILGLLAFAVGASLVASNRRASVLALSAFLGLVCASRPTMLLFVSGVFVIEASRGKWQRALTIATIAVLVGSVFTGTIYARDPETFTPFHVTSKSGGIIAGIAAVVLALGWQALVFFVLRQSRSAAGGSRFSRWSVSLEPTGRLALVLGPAGFLMALPPAMSFGQWYHLFYASFTTMVAPLAVLTPFELRRNESRLQSRGAHH